MPSADEKVVMLEAEIDNLNQKIAFLEKTLKDLKECRSIPQRDSFEVTVEGIGK